MSEKITIHLVKPRQPNLVDLDPYHFIGITCSISKKYVLVPKGTGVVFTNGRETWLSGDSRESVLRIVNADIRVKIHAFETLSGMAEWLSSSDE